jgi:hypothetical protein
LISRMVSLSRNSPGEIGTFNSMGSGPGCAAWETGGCRRAV